MMSVSAVAKWASIESFAPPPVAPTRSIPPALSGPVFAGLPAAVALLPPLLPPQAARIPPALSAAPPISAPCSTCRRVSGCSDPSRTDSSLTGAPLLLDLAGVHVVGRRVRQTGDLAGDQPG